MTLLEALVVVAITALITAIGFPALRTGDTARAVRSESAALTADLKRAHAAAIHLDKPVALAVDRDGAGWRWPGGALRLDPGIRLAAPQGAPQGVVTFYPDGTASGATFTLGTRSRAVRIEVDRTTGTVTTTGR